MTAENLLERMDILKHHPTVEEINAANIKSRELTADYLEDRIDLSTYRAELDSLPKLDLRQLAEKLHVKP